MRIRNIHLVPSSSGHGGALTQWKLFSKDEFLSPMNAFNANILNPGGSLEPYKHESEKRIYFILAGLGIARVGEEEQEAREGDTVYLPPRLAHSLRNTGTYPLRFLIIGILIK